MQQFPRVYIYLRQKFETVCQAELCSILHVNAICHNNLMLLLEKMHVLQLTVQSTTGEVVVEISRQALVEFSALSEKLRKFYEGKGPIQAVCSCKYLPVITNHGFAYWRVLYKQDNSTIRENVQAIPWNRHVQGQKESNRIPIRQLSWIHGAAETTRTQNQSS